MAQVCRSCAWMVFCYGTFCMVRQLRMRLQKGLRHVTFECVIDCLSCLPHQMAQERKNHTVQFSPWLGLMDQKEPRPSDDPLDFYRSVVSNLIPLFLQLLRAVIELEQVLSERRRRRIQGLDSIPSPEPWSPEEGEEEEGGEEGEEEEAGEEGEEEESLSLCSASPAPSTPLPVPSPDHHLFDGQERDNAEGSKKRERIDDAGAGEEDAADDTQTASKKSKESDSKWGTVEAQYLDALHAQSCRKKCLAKSRSQ